MISCFFLFSFTMIMMITFAAAVEENTKWQKFSIVEFNPKIFTAGNEMQQTRFQSTYS